MYSKGDIVIIQFPFSDLMNAKKRPMLVLAEKGQDIIGCAITSNLQSEGIGCKNFSEGSLPLESKVKYWQLHTIMKSLVVKKIAKLSKQNHALVLNEIEKLFEQM